MSSDDIYRRAVERYGREAQLRQLQEECCELGAAINQLARKRLYAMDVAMEIADVEIMCAQARVIIGDELVDEAKSEKLARLEARLGGSDE